ncbi:hypothetical protein ASE86_07770 [Sphingomonas sp. Leaf33]|uniref:TniB family NTP-binding protein n=1 Tax=Sphingomonas sp. Leaf33 TaxID=1736215 RepID=UPI0006FBE079|nr:TniB family NTP-binding protein [Sphingomonas sp. Leaf33]KQN26051.1 hypothetical protein ASE86_07770 [Sphingomonas sp. Leaf33]
MTTSNTKIKDDGSAAITRRAPNAPRRQFGSGKAKRDPRNAGGPVSERARAGNSRPVVAERASDVIERETNAVTAEAVRSERADGLEVAAKSRDVAVAASTSGDWTAGASDAGDPVVDALLPQRDLATPEPEPQQTLSPEMQDAFRAFRKSQLAQRSSRVALALSQLMRIRLPYPRHIEAMAEIEELLLLGREMRGEQQLALNVFSRTGTGKSTVATQFKLMRAQDDPPGVRSVLHARMGTSGTARDLYSSIMSEVGDGFASSGTEHTLRRRAMRAMEDNGVELLILDETQHSGQKSGFSREVTAELKIMLDTGRVPIVLLGTEAAIPIVGSDRELSGRMFSPCRLDPLDMADDDDLELWLGFLGALDDRMVSDGIVASGAGLAEEGLALALGEVCDGVIGQLMRVMTMALRNAVREQRDVVTTDDISIAVDEWSMEHGFARSNPLRRL